MIASAQNPLSRPAKALIGVLLAIGAALRIGRYADNASLWVDEAKLVLNLIERSAAALRAPLAYDQGAPYGFLLLEKLALTAGDSSELSLRIVPLFASLLALPLFFGVARRLLPMSAALFASALFVFCEPLIFYAAQVKPYALDVCVGLWISWAALRRPDGIGLLCAGAVGVWISHTAVFVCAGVGLAILWRKARDARRLAVVGGWLLSFAVLYASVLRGTTGSAGLHRFWAAGFMPLPPGSFEDLLWFPRSALGAFADPAGFAYPLFSLSIFTIGCVWMFRSSRRTLAILAFPLLAVLGASAAKLYPFPTLSPIEHPFHGRLVLFVVPILFVGVAAGVAPLWQPHGILRRFLGVAIGFLLLAPQASEALLRSVDPPRLQELRPLAESLAADFRAGDVIYVYHEAIPALLYYTRTRALEIPKDWTEIPKDGSHMDYAALERTIRDNTRVWVVFVHHALWKSRKEEEMFLDRLTRKGIQISKREESGASLNLFLVRPPL